MDLERVQRTGYSGQVYELLKHWELRTKWDPTCVEVSNPYALLYCFICEATQEH